MMTVNEIARMTAWLRAEGMEAEKILDLIEYIATGIRPEEQKSEKPEE